MKIIIFNTLNKPLVTVDDVYSWEAINENSIRINGCVLKFFQAIKYARIGIPNEEKKKEYEEMLKEDEMR